MARLAETLESARTIVDVPRWVPSAAGEVLNEVGEYVDFVIAELRSRMHEAGIGTSQMASICEIVLTLQQLRAEQQQLLADERIRALTAIRPRTALFGGHRDAASLLKSAAEAACKASGLDRAMVFKLEDGYLHAMSTYFAGHQEWGAECQRRAEQVPIQMVPGVLETEVVRRRLPALISDPLHDPQAYQPIVGMIRTPGYVATPIFVNGQIAATLHLDAYDSGRNVDNFDRDLAADLAASIGQALERLATLQQLMRQRALLDDLARQTEAHIRFLTGSAEPSALALPKLTVQPERLSGSPASTDPATHSTRPARNLTRRETEVLQLMSTGATNAEIAARLVVAEGTVKTHVKRILRKLNAGNRGQAAAHYTSVMREADPHRVW